MPILSAGLGAVLQQQQTLAPQQQYALRILRMSAQELLDEAALAAEENPLIERDSTAQEATAGQPTALHEEAESVSREGESLDSPEDRGPLENAYSGWSRQGNQDEDTPAIERVAAPVSLREDLLTELGSLRVDELTHELVTCLIDELDDTGFLPAPIEKIAQELSGVVVASLEDWQRALTLLQTFDPPGVGAHSFTESLILQAQRRFEEGEASAQTVALLKRLVTEALSQIASQDRKALLRVADGNEVALNEALALLKRLTLHPAAEYANVNTQYVVADILVTKHHDTWSANLNAAAQPGLRISNLAQSVAVDESSAFGHYLAEAKRLVSGIEARQATLLRTARFAVAHQQAFFERGQAALVPLTIGEAAAALELSDSTVSRAVSGKYFQCPLGTFELRSLFLLPAVQTVDASGMSAAVTPAHIRARIRELISAEPAGTPLTDQALTDMLRAEGVAITRRTVAKYRDLEGIPVARLRATAN